MGRNVLEAGNVRLEQVSECVWELPPDEAPDESPSD